MNASNKEYLKLHADAEWMKDILKRINDILNNEMITEDHLKSCRWLVKQGLKCERED